MKHLSIIISLFIISIGTSWAQESAEESLSDIIEVQGQATVLKILKQGWGAYKLEDYETAFGLWMPLAEGGNSSAQVFIGLMYSQGNAVEQDSNEAAKWYAFASEQGHAAAKWRLAMLYYHGNGVIQSYLKALELYHSAAKQGDVYSQKSLGIMYSKGLGVPKDNVVAYSWFDIAGNNGFKPAEKYKNKIAKEMTPEETAIAQAMAKECMKSGYSKCGWASTTDGNPIENDS